MRHNMGTFIHFTVTMTKNMSVKLRDQLTNSFTDDPQLRDIIIHVMYALTQYQVITFHKNLT